VGNAGLTTSDIFGASIRLAEEREVKKEGRKIQDNNCPICLKTLEATTDSKRFRRQASGTGRTIKEKESVQKKGERGYGWVQHKHVTVEKLVTKREGQASRKKGGGWRAGKGLEEGKRGT